MNWPLLCPLFTIYILVFPHFTVLLFSRRNSRNLSLPSSEPPDIFFYPGILYNWIFLTDSKLFLLSCKDVQLIVDTYLAQNFFPINDVGHVTYPGISCNLRTSYRPRASVTTEPTLRSRSSMIKISCADVYNQLSRFLWALFCCVRYNFVF